MRSGRERIEGFCDGRGERELMGKRECMMMLVGNGLQMEGSETEYFVYSLWVDCTIWRGQWRFYVLDLYSRLSLCSLLFSKGSQNRCLFEDTYPNEEHTSSCFGSINFPVLCIG